MRYATVQAPPTGRSVQVPEDRADDEAWREAAGELLGAALREQRRAFEAHRDGRVFEALRRAGASVRLFPYSADVIEGALLLALQHGDAGQALAFIRQAEHAGCDDLAATYRATAEAAAERWNRFLHDDEALAAAHQSGDALALRELLLLADRAPEALTGTDRRRLREAGVRSLPGERAGDRASQPPRGHPAENGPPASPRRATLLAGLVVGAVGLALGLLVASAFDGGDAPSDTELRAAWAEVEKQHAQNDDRARRLADRRRRLDTAAQNVRRFAAANTQLAAGQPLEAMRQARAVRPDSAIRAGDAARLRGAIRRGLLRQGERAWYERDFPGVVSAMQPALARPPADSATVGEDRAEQHYRLGVAARRIGRDSLATEHLHAALLDASGQRRYFEAEAAHALATLLAPGEEARRYARLIADRYAGTVYDTDAIRRLLDS